MGNIRIFLVTLLILIFSINSVIASCYPSEAERASPSGNCAGSSGYYDDAILSQSGGQFCCTYDSFTNDAGSTSDGSGSYGGETESGGSDTDNFISTDNDDLIPDDTFDDSNTDNDSSNFYNSSEIKTDIDVTGIVKTDEDKQRGFKDDFDEKTGDTSNSDGSGISDFIKNFQEALSD